MTSPRKLLAASVLATLCLLALPAHAGTADDPEVQGAQDSMECERGVLVGSPAIDERDFHDVDILKAWVQESDDAVNITVETVGEGGDDTQMNVSFVIRQGPDSLPGSTANGTRHHINATGTTPEGVEGSTVERHGPRTYFNFTRDDVGALGGDELAELVVETHNRDDGPTDTSFDDQACRDRAPAEGETSRPYRFILGDIEAGLTLSLLGGTIEETAEGETRSRSFTEGSVETQDPQATIVFEVAVRNTGNVEDNISLSVGALADVAASLSESSFHLAPGAERAVDLTLQLDGASPGRLEPQVQATSALGAAATATAAVTVLEPEAPPAATPTPTPTPTPPPGPVVQERDPVLPIGFLTGLAEATGMDDVFGDWAEVVLLGLILLLAILLVFLLLFLGTRQSTIIELTPRSQRAAPGEHAEFAVMVQNRKKIPVTARLHFESDDPHWKTGVLLTQEEGATLDPLTNQDQELEFALNGRNDPGSRYTGHLRVQVPETARDGETNRVSLGVVPVDERGEERRRQARFAHARIHSDLAAATPKPEVTPNVRLSEVAHEPVQPEPGEEVTTEARLENDDAERTWVMKVVLNIDGEDVQEQIVAVPAQKARMVVFNWTAAKEEHRVRVLVYEKAPEEKV